MKQIIVEIIAWIVLLETTGVLVRWLTLVIQKVRISHTQSIIVAFSIYMIYILLNGGVLNWI